MPEELRGISRSVVIGLGGTGQEVVLRLRKLMATEYGSVDAMAAVRYLVIDTDNNYSVSDSSLIVPDYQLRTTELIKATIADPKPIYENIRKGKDGGQEHIAEWFDVDKLRTQVNISEGARSIRQIGRLCFYHNYNTISARLKALRAQMDPNDLAEAMRSMPTPIELDPGYTIYIVCSLAGGTGSGMLLDMAYVAREIFQREGQPTKIIGILLMPQAFQDVDNSDRKKANGYAALKELNYYSYQGQPGSDTDILYRGRQFRAVYDKSSIENQVDRKEHPFEYCYLVDTTNTRGITLVRSQLFEMIARNLTVEFTSKFAQHKRGLRDNIQSVFAGSGTDRRGCPLQYYSFGLSSIYFPSREIEKALVYKLARAATSQWISIGQRMEHAKEIKSANISEAVEDFMRSNRFLERPPENRRDLLDRILTSDNSDNLSQRAARFKGNVERKWQEENWPTRDYPANLHSATNVQERRFRQPGPDENTWGEWAQTMAVNGRTVLRDFTELIHVTIADMIEDPKRGPSYAYQFLDALAEHLKDCTDTFRDEYSVPKRMAAVLGNVRIIGDLGDKLRAGLEPALQDKENECMHQVDAATRSIIRPGERVRQHGREYLTWATLRMRARCERIARETANKYIDQIIDGSIKQERERIDRVKLFLKQLVSELERFQEEYEKYTKVININGELLYGEEVEETVNRFYHEYIADEAEMINLIRNKVLQKPELAGGFGHALRLLDLPDQADKRPNLIPELKDAIVKECEILVTEFHVGGKRLTELTAAAEMVRSEKSRPELMSELRSRLGSVYTKAGPFINLLAVVPDWTANELGTARLVGMQSVDAGDSATELVIEAMEQFISPASIKSIPDAHQILFTEELGGFPLRAVAGVSTLKTTYDSVNRQAAQAPLHFCKHSEHFPDIFPDTQELKESHCTWVLGNALGIIERDYDQNWIYSYEEDGIPKAKLLGSSEQICLLTLIRNEELRKAILEEAYGIEIAVAKPELMRYLKELASQLENGVRDPYYLRVSEIILDYQKSSRTPAVAEESKRLPKAKPSHGNTG